MSMHLSYIRFENKFLYVLTAFTKQCPANAASFYSRELLTSLILRKKDIKKMTPLNDKFG
jgi:hypothetical protein